MSFSRTHRCTLSAAALAIGFGGAAHGAIVGTETDFDLGGGPVTFSIQGDASYTFSNSGETGDFFPVPLPAVETGGTAGVNTNPEILGGGIATYFTDEGRRPFIDENLLGAGFQSYDAPGTIDAQTPSYIALQFDQDDGTHFGFARLNRLTLSAFAYEDTPGQGIQAQPGPYDRSIAPVPLPASLPLFGLALAGLGGFARRRRA